jgi:CubicO group peptidase (beta-lactamase class C family)
MSIDSLRSTTAFFLAHFAAAILCLLSGCHRGDTRQLREVVEGQALPMMAEHRVPGLAIAVVRRGEVECFCFGVASRSGKEPVTPDTLFELGSVSKTFTGLLGAWVHVEGGFAFEDAASKRWDVLAGSAFDRVTMGQLATYAAGGLPLQVPGEVRDDAQLVGYLQRWQPEHQPGSTRLYSNPSIGVFGRAAAKSAGWDFSEMMTSTILPALGMHDTYLKVPDVAMPRYAWGLDEEDREVRVNTGVLEAEAYGLKSTAADMGRYLQAQIRPRSGAADSKRASTLAKAMEQTREGRFSVGPMTQGLGWELYPYPVRVEDLLEGNSPKVVREPNAVSPPRRLDGAVLLNKTGATGGFSAYVVVVPEKEVGVVLLANRFVPGPARIRAVHAILDAVGR